jgi:hypothetical protein
LAGRTPREAVQNFLEPLQEVVSCVTDEGFVAREFNPSGGPYAAAFQGGFAILDREHGLPPVKLELIHQYRVVEGEGDLGRWKVSTAEWIYEVADQGDALIVAFHWHPDSGRTAWPHLHAYGEHPSVHLHKLHLPTGRVSIESVVRFLVADLSVKPRRENWRDVLDRREAAFRQWRTWH